MGLSTNLEFNTLEYTILYHLINTQFDRLTYAQYAHKDKAKENTRKFIKMKEKWEKAPPAAIKTINFFSKDAAVSFLFEKIVCIDFVFYLNRNVFFLFLFIICECIDFG